MKGAGMVEALSYVHKASGSISDRINTPLPSYPLSYWPRTTLSLSFLVAQAIFEPNLFPYKYSKIFKPSHPSYLSAYEDGIECSETSVYKIQMPGTYPEESIQHSENGVSLKSVRFC